MINRLYDNGMLMSGEVRHCNCWEYPTMPRLQRHSTISAKPSKPISRQRGYVALLFDVFRAR